MRRPDPETGVALLLLFVGLPLCVAVLASLIMIFWRWPAQAGAMALVGWALWCIATRLDRGGEPF